MSLEDDSYYKSEVQNHPEICNNCFRRCVEAFKPSHSSSVQKRRESDGETVHWVEWSRIRDSVPIRTMKWKRLDRSESADMGRVCKCGVFSTTTVLRSADDALSKEQSLKLAERLANRVEEQATDFDRSLFIQTVDELKSDEEMSNKDDQIFDTAVEVGFV